MPPSDEGSDFGASEDAMYWQTRAHEASTPAQAESADLAFRVRCARLPVEHAYALSEALLQHLPWLQDEPCAGIHTIHGAASGNGWTRPRATVDEVFSPSRRTRLVLRLPPARVGAARRLEGVLLDVAGCPLAVGEATLRTLAPQPEQFARYVASAAGESEGAFLHRIAGALEARAIPARRLLCGRSAALHTPQGTLLTRSLLVADLRGDEARALQQTPLGEGRLLGCGLFVPHKSIAALADGQGGHG